MAVTVVSGSGVRGRAERWLFRSREITVVTVGMLVALAFYGFQLPPITVTVVAEDPFMPYSGWVWLYQSPLGAMLAHALGMTTATRLAIFNALVLVVVVVGCASMIRVWVSDLAGRLFSLAFLASPQASMSLLLLGWFDVITIGALTVATVAPLTIVGSATLVLGFHHFEQGVLGLVTAVVARRIMFPDQSLGRFAAVAFTGLAVGKAAQVGYLLAAGIPVNGRAEFVEARGGYASFVDVWAGRIQFVPWTVYGVIWVAVAAMWWRLPTRSRWLLAGVQAVMVLPLFIVVDLTRVYSVITWPIVVLTVVWWSRQPDQATTRRWAMWFLVASFVVPRVVVFEDYYWLSAWNP